MFKGLCFQLDERRGSGHTPSTSDVRALEKRLMPLSNKDLRGRAFATRDACDLSEDDEMRKAYSSALQVILDMAGRRGLDIDRGRHDPRKALDPDLARAHTDSAAELPEHLQARRRKRDMTGS